MRRFVLLGSCGLLLIAVGLFVAGRLMPPRPSQWVLPPEPPPEPIPVFPPEEPDPTSAYTPREQTILRFMRRVQPDTLSRVERAEYEQREREFREAGAYSPDMLPFYLRLLTADSGFNWQMEGKILRQVARIPGDRSAFRQPVVERLKHSRPGVVGAALRLLKEVGTSAEAAEVAKLIENYEFDHPGDRFFDDVAYAVLDTLSAIGTEAEIKALEQAMAHHFLWDDDKFWAKAEACKTAIRERLAKEKEQADKK